MEAERTEQVTKEPEVDRRAEPDLSRAEWLEGAGRFVLIHAGNESHRYPLPLGALGARLDADRFVRIHRSTIVNIDNVVAVHIDSGAAEVELRDGTRLALSRNQRRLQDELEAREEAAAEPASF